MLLWEEPQRSSNPDSKYTAYKNVYGTQFYFHGYKLYVVKFKKYIKSDL